MDKNINLFMKKLHSINGFHNVKFVILYGSRSTGLFRNDSDYDFAIYYNGNKRERFDFLIKANFNENFDAKIFQDLPLYIMKDVLKGKVVYVEDLGFLYDVAYKTIKSFDSFKKYYYDYISRRPEVKWYGEKRLGLVKLKII